MQGFVTALPHPDAGPYTAALNLLEASEHIAIAQIDSGVWPHPGLGWTDLARPPANLLVDRGVNFLDPGGAAGTLPLARLRKPGGAAGLLEYPDHGVKTLSALIGPGPRLRGVVPGARVVPYRVANGPLFRAGGRDAPEGPVLPRASTALIGRAIEHALALDPPVRVVTISMGNPGHLGVFEPVRLALGGEVGMAEETARAIDAAHDRGVIVVCAAGQVIDGVIYPAKFARTIAVGGYDLRGAEHIHYPRDGWRDLNWDGLVDVWAQAERINRAAYDMSGPVPRPVFADEFPAGEPSGTSYACPQAAGAAALWLARHGAALEAAFGAPADRWKIVESFRAALRASADRRMALMRPFAGAPTREIRVLNIPRLLARAPDPDATLTRPAPAVAGGAV